MRIDDLSLAGAPSRAHVDVERLLDGTLPDSFVAFVEHVGWARTFGLWLVHPPVLAGYADGLDGRGAELTRRLRASYEENRAEDFDWIIEPDGSWEIAAGLVVFAHSENGDDLAWDARGPLVDGEHPVYLSQRGDNLRLVGASLGEALDVLRAESPFAAETDCEPLAAARLDEA